MVLHGSSFKRCSFRFLCLHHISVSANCPRMMALSFWWSTVLHIGNGKFSESTRLPTLKYTNLHENLAMIGKRELEFSCPAFSPNTLNLHIKYYMIEILDFCLRIGYTVWHSNHSLFASVLCFANIWGFEDVRSSRELGDSCLWRKAFVLAMILEIYSADIEFLCKLVCLSLHEGSIVGYCFSFLSCVLEIRMWD